MTTYLVTILLVFALMLTGIAVDRLYRRFAARHPQLGPYRNGEGSCGCCSGKCQTPGETTSCTSRQIREREVSSVTPQQ
ncbi:MAG: hypothetical protein ACK4N6_00635 [Rhodocyclaceae bacterium]